MSERPACRAVVVAVVIVLTGLPSGARAQAPLLESGAFTLDVGGYVLSLTGIHDTGYDVPDGDRLSGFHSVVARIEWNAGWGRNLRFELHDRVQGRVSSAGGGLGRSVAGIGVSADPGRAVDLESVWIDEERTRVWHDVERLALTVYTPVADVTVGRQAVTWGNALLFPVADLWAAFSPYELDTAEKPGVDAVRLLAYPSSGLELDAVLADRGARDEVSAGIRATWSLAAADVYGAVGRFWNEAAALGGVTWLLESTKLRMEGALARDLDADRWLDARTTVGVDRIGPRWTISVEYHHNGLGAPTPDAYLSRLRSPVYARGESYFVGRDYLGGAATWSADAEERLRISGTALVNLSDGSGAFLPSGSWDVGRAARISVGALLTTGEEPELGGPVPKLRSEYGTYGSMGYVRLSVYF